MKIIFFIKPGLIETEVRRRKTEVLFDRGLRIFMSQLFLRFYSQ